MEERLTELDSKLRLKMRNNLKAKLKAELERLAIEMDMLKLELPILNQKEFRLDVEIAIFEYKASKTRANVEELRANVEELYKKLRAYNIWLFARTTRWSEKGSARQKDINELFRFLFFKKKIRGAIRWQEERLERLKLEQKTFKAIYKRILEERKQLRGLRGESSSLASSSSASSSSASGGKRKIDGKSSANNRPAQRRKPTTPTTLTVPMHRMNQFVMSIVAQVKHNVHAGEFALLGSIINSPDIYPSHNQKLEGIINGIIDQICVGGRDTDEWKQVIRQFVEISLQELAQQSAIIVEIRVIQRSVRRGGEVYSLAERLGQLLDVENGSRAAV